MEGDPLFFVDGADAANDAAMGTGLEDWFGFTHRAYVDRNATLAFCGATHVGVRDDAPGDGGASAAWVPFDELPAGVRRWGKGGDGDGDGDGAGGTPAAVLERLRGAIGARHFFDLYRMHLVDPIVFHSDLTLRWEFAEATPNVSALAVLYLAPASAPPGLRRTDAIAPHLERCTANRRARCELRRAPLSSTAAPRVEACSARAGRPAGLAPDEGPELFEGTYLAPVARPPSLFAPSDGPPVELERGDTLSFVVALARRNCGALLRRTFRYAHANQLARVVLGARDGRSWALEWFSPGYNRQWTLAQADLELPLSATRGQAALNVTLAALSSVVSVGHVSVFSVMC